MTQSKKNNQSDGSIDDYVITLDDDIDLSNITTDTVTVNLDNTYGTTTTFWNGDNITDININSSDYDGTFTITSDTSDTINIGDWAYYDNKIDPDKVKRMCKQYPALNKVWENFSSMYEMCKQDYEGKIKAGEINDLDDDIPF